MNVYVSLEIIDSTQIYCLMLQCKTILIIPACKSYLLGENIFKMYLRAYIYMLEKKTNQEYFKIKSGTIKFDVWLNNDSILLYLPVSSLRIYTFVVSRAFMASAASQAGDADSSRAPGLISGLQGSVNVHRGALLLVPQ